MGNTQEQEKKEVVEQKKDEQAEKTVPYDRFSQVVSQKKAIEDELARIKLEHQQAADAAQAAKLKDEGDYKALIAKAEADRKVEKEKIANMVRSTFLTSVGIKNNIAKMDYVELFKAKIDVSEDLEIKNAKEVEDAFVKWKDENKNLFNNEQKVVPKTDNKPLTKPDNIKETALSSYEKMVLGLKERNK